MRNWKIGLAKAWDSGVEVGVFYTDINNEDSLSDIAGDPFTAYVSKSF